MAVKIDVDIVDLIDPLAKALAETFDDDLINKWLRTLLNTITEYQKSSAVSSDKPTGEKLS